MIAEKESRRGDGGLPHSGYERGVGGAIPMAIERVEGNSDPAPSMLDITRPDSVGSIAWRKMRVGDFVFVVGGHAISDEM